MLQSLTIVMPAYNEEARLPATLVAVQAWMDTCDFDVELLVVNDGSRDRTSEVVSSAHAGDPRIRLLEMPQNRGKGAAVRAGVLASSKDWVLISDADLSTPIEEAERLAAAAVARLVAVAIGSRDVEDSDIVHHQPWYREAMGRTFNRVVQTLAVPGIRDTQCGFKLLRADAAKAVFERATVDGFAFDVELLVLARKLGYEIAEVGVRWRNDERSTVDPIRDSARMFVDVVRIRLRHLRR